MVVAAWNSHNALKTLVDKILSSRYVWHHSISHQITVLSQFLQSLTPSFPRYYNIVSTFCSSNRCQTNIIWTILQTFKTKAAEFVQVEGGEASAAGSNMTGRNMTGGEEKEPNPSNAGGKGGGRKRTREWSYKAVATSTHFCFLCFPISLRTMFFFFSRLCISFHIWRFFLY